MEGTMKEPNTQTDTTEQTTNRDRPARNPGGVECTRCDCVFIGEEWHTLCRVCVELTAAEIAKVQHG